MIPKRSKSLARHRWPREDRYGRVWRRWSAGRSSSSCLDDLKSDPRARQVWDYVEELDLSELSIPEYGAAQAAQCDDRSTGAGHRPKDSGHYLAWVTGKNVRVSMVHDLRGVIGRPRGPQFEV